MSTWKEKKIHAQKLSNVEVIKYLSVSVAFLQFQAQVIG